MPVHYPFNSLSKLCRTAGSCLKIYIAVLLTGIQSTLIHTAFSDGRFDAKLTDYICVRFHTNGGGRPDYV